MRGFVGIQKVSSPEQISDLIKKLEHDPSYYFVRSLGMVSGICMKQPDNFPGDEGQMFNYQRELRWKKQGSQYDLLLLSQVESDLDSKWQKISRESNREIEWKICDRQAHFYDSDETRFPQGFVYKGMNDKNIEPKTIPIFQRYFQNADTATVHFVALTLKQ